MKCQKCKKKVTVQYLDNDFCNSCFLKTIEKRIRKHLRTSKSIKKQGKIIAVGSLTYEILTKIIKNPKITIKKETNIPKKVETDTKIAIPWTMDHENHYFLKHFIEKKPQTFLKKSKFIKLLLPITDREAKILAKIKHLKYKPLQKDQYTKFFDMLETKYSSVRYAFSSSVKEFRKL